jgi:Invasion associated locus B (IalB) protein
MTMQSPRPFPTLFLGITLTLSLMVSAGWPAYGQQAVPAGTQPGGPEVALRGQREARDIKFGAWEKFFKPGGAKMVCRTTISGTFNTGQTAVRLYLTEREDTDGARLQLFLPVGLYLPDGATLAVIRAQPIDFRSRGVSPTPALRAISPTRTCCATWMLDRSSSCKWSTPTCCR